MVFLPGFQLARSSDLFAAPARGPVPGFG